MPLPLPLPPQGPGAPPPGMPAPPGGTGPSTTAGPMPGAAAHGAAGIKTALEMLQKALPTIPMGGKMHSAVLKAVTDLTKAMADDPNQGSDPSAMIQQLIAAQKQNAQQPPMPPPGMPNMGGGGAPPPEGMAA